MHVFVREQQVNVDGGQIPLPGLEHIQKILRARRIRHPAEHLLVGHLNLEGAMLGRCEERLGHLGTRCSLVEPLREDSLARGVRRSDGDQHARHGEERDMPVEWVALDDLRAAVLDGRLHNPSLVVAVLAGCAARADGWAGLRPADAPWRIGPRQLR